MITNRDKIMLEARIIQSTRQSQCCIYDEIKSFSAHKHLLDELYNAYKSDVIVIRIASPGGRLDVGTEIINAIKETQATTVARITFSSASIASMIALSCDGLIIDRYQSLMFHTYSAGCYGKSDEILQDVNNTNTLVIPWMNELCSPFLTKTELNRINKGEDLYIKWDDSSLNKRVRRHFNLQVANSSL